MAMPQDLVLIRHGQSEANVRQKAGKEGDNRLFTEELVTVPDQSWRLTELGETQAKIAGAYLRNEFPQGFDRYIVSPFIRTRETAANLRLPGAQWEENRMVRERSWGDIDALSRDEFKRQYPNNARIKEINPIYWCPPAGESLSTVAETRSSRVIQNLSRESSGKQVLVVAHGDFNTATRMFIEQWSDEQFLEVDADESQRMRNCMMIRYSSLDPEWKRLSEDLHWVKLAYPAMNEQGQHSIVDSGWRRFDGAPKLSDDDLLKLVATQERRLAPIEGIRSEATGSIDTVALD